MINLCACMGIRVGNKYCYCEMKRRGLDVSHYDWSEEEQEDFRTILKILYKEEKE